MLIEVVFLKIVFMCMITVTQTAVIVVYVRRVEKKLLLALFHLSQY